MFVGGVYVVGLVFWFGLVGWWSNGGASIPESPGSKPPTKGYLRIATTITAVILLIIAKLSSVVFWFLDRGVTVGLSSFRPWQWPSALHLTERRLES